MSTILRKIITASFILTTVALTFTLSYTSNLYYGIYSATRGIDFKIHKFDVKIHNTSYVMMETELLVENPSEYVFQAVTIEERFELNGEYIVTMHLDWINPADISPKSNTTFMSQQKVPSHLTQYVAEQTQRNWIIRINARIKCPMVGELTITFYDFPQSHYTNSQS